MSAFAKWTLGRCFTFSTVPLDRLSYMVKLLVESESLLHKCEPMKPAPPVTSILFSLSEFMKITAKSISLFG